MPKKKFYCLKFLFFSFL
uniref:Uncharacterized protein n=1 Tax=Rhizophora mucronata TaxID=61149 RepID=A0A2P2IND0_RHIMU